jgi:shikimate dehydrogenase
MRMSNVRGVQHKGLDLAGKRVLVAGNGGVGSAVAASLAAAGVARTALYDAQEASSRALAGRLRAQPAAGDRHGLQRPRGLRPHRRRDAAGHEGR